MLSQSKKDNDKVLKSIRVSTFSCKEAKTKAFQKNVSEGEKHDNKLSFLLVSTLWKN